MVEYAFEYDYDGAHNRTVKVVDGVPTYYAYNEANELLTETTGGETTYYHYDGRGNTVAKQEPSGTTYYAYNTENLMTRIDFAAGGSSYYDYDADSKRVSQRTPDGYRAFVYQGPDMLKLQMERDESEETVARYTMGSGLEAMRRGTSSFYHYNHLGTALALTGADEAVTDTYRHDAWGVLLASTGSTVNPHTYVGRERYYRMPEAEMYHLGFRDYAQGLGRFTTVDPLSQLQAGSTLPRLQLHRWREHSGTRSRLTPIAGAQAAWPVAYIYVRNAPTSLSDASGLQPMPPDQWCASQCYTNWRECIDDAQQPVGDCIRDWFLDDVIPLPFDLLSLSLCALVCLPSWAAGPIAYTGCLGLCLGAGVGLIGLANIVPALLSCNALTRELRGSCDDAYGFCCYMSVKHGGGACLELPGGWGEGPQDPSWWLDRRSGRLAAGRGLRQ